MKFAQRTVTARVTDVNVPRIGPRKAMDTNVVSAPVQQTATPTVTITMNVAATIASLLEAEAFANSKFY